MLELGKSYPGHAPGMLTTFLKQPRARRRGSRGGSSVHGLERDHHPLPVPPHDQRERAIRAGRQQGLPDRVERDDGPAVDLREDVADPQPGPLRTAPRQDAAATDGAAGGRAPPSSGWPSGSRTKKPYSAATRSAATASGIAPTVTCTGRRPSLAAQHREGHASRRRSADAMARCRRARVHHRAGRGRRRPGRRCARPEASAGVSLITSTITAPKPSRRPNFCEISSISCSDRSRMRTPSHPQRVGAAAAAARAGLAARSSAVIARVTRRVAGGRRLR